MTRTLRLLAVSGAAALALSGCGDGTVRTGAAATVGSDRITTTALADVVSRGLASPLAQQAAATDRIGLERNTLGRLIERVLLTKAAAQEHVSVDGAADDAELDSYVAQAGGQQQLTDAAAKAGIAAADLPAVIHDFAVRDALADKLTESVPVPGATLRAAYQQGIGQFDQVHSAHILVASEALANKILAQVKADPSQFATLAAQYSTDTANKSSGGDLGFQGRGALEKPFEAAIFGNPAGSFVIAHTKFGFHVIHVIERKTTPFAQAKVTLRRGLLDQQRAAALATYLQKLTRTLGVHVNPRFGTWDAGTQAVVAAATCPNTAFSSASPHGVASATPAADPTASPTCTP